ncbi:hypothetical protein ACNJC6_01742 [Acinetobacter johnsonii]|uniref:KTSC domain-containing protein n=2 Tax=Acinetobacter johnsonii TaxID=40214 RepID=A0A1R7QCW0_ACIJO|nr:hypothetical protein ACNJC6_01742 [Acinetobacter johnsonii]
MDMERYLDLDGDSGVVGYEIGDTLIRVKFSGTVKIYTYSYRSAGIDKVERMKQLAKVGNGLNAYIKLNANSLYEK